MLAFIQNLFKSYHCVLFFECIAKLVHIIYQKVHLGANILFCCTVSSKLKILYKFGPLKM